MPTDDWRDTLSALAQNLHADDSPSDVDSADTGAIDVRTSHQQGPVHIALERKGRAGKTATIIYGFTISDTDLKALATDLKRTLGCGGSARDGEILLQGDRIAALRSLLIARGFKVK